MPFSDLINRFLGKDQPQPQNSPSKNVAKERLQLVLVHDRSDVSEKMMENLREDLIAVINKYMEIDQKSLDVSFSREDGAVALIANIPIVRIKR